MNSEALREQGMIIFEAISGSRAYGLDTPSSDTDIRGVFVQPLESFYGSHSLSQVNDEDHNTVFYEIGKFMELLSKSNPTVLELLYTPDDCVLYENDLFRAIRSQNFLSKRCADTFVKYATSQLKKAQGLKKKIVNPVEKERKTPLDFCYVVDGGKSRSLLSFLKEHGVEQRDCGLAALNHVRDGYALFVSAEHSFRGLLAKEESHEVCVSSIPKDLEPLTYLFFNRDAYKTYSTKYREYWEWVKKRNPERYQTNESHGKGYDSKNVMHVFRLLSMAEDIAKKGVIDLRGGDRDFLLEVRAGKFEYDFLMNLAWEKAEALQERFVASTLPDEPNGPQIERLLVELRSQHYLHRVGR
jgi:hypothetical protein